MTYFVSGGMYNPSQSTVVIVNNNVTVFLQVRTFGVSLYGIFMSDLHCQSTEGDGGSMLYAWRIIVCGCN